MGFYDCRCMITGVSLKASEAALVLLQKIDDTYSPTALACKGTYNRLGSIDGIEEDENTDLILKFFLHKEETGEFIVEKDYLEGHDCYPIQNIEQLLQGFERNINDNPQAAVLNGRPILFSLICSEVWEALARAAPTSKKPLTNLFKQLFGNSGVAHNIYGTNLDDLLSQIRELLSVKKFMADRGLEWKPADDTSQHYSEEMNEYLKEAKSAFSDSALILKALKAYERNVRDFLNDED